MRSTLKLLLAAAVLTGSVGHVFAAETARDQERQKRATRQLVAAFLDAQCSAIGAREQPSMAGSAPSYAASNADLHKCQYIQQMVVTNCLNTGCPSYEAWSKTNAAFSPSLPKATFALMYTARQTWLNALRTNLP